MNDRINLPNKNILLQNFHTCINWEEKYLYIIELGNYLPTIPKSKKIKKNLVPGCQSNVWIIVKMTHCVINKKKTVNLYGDSDAAITKGILSIIFSIYQGFSAEELIKFNPYSFLKNQLELTEHLTYSRSQGIQSIIRFIYDRVKVLIYKNKNK